jgi:hypothetical protein
MFVRHLLSVTLALCLVPALALADKKSEDKKKAEAAKKNAAKKAKPKTGTFAGMVVRVEGSHEKGSIVIKHANGTGKGFEVSGKTAISGLGVSALHHVRKGQLVTLHFADKKATKIEVTKKAEKTVNLSTKAKFSGTVEKVVSDQFGDNGQVWVKDAKGKTREFQVGNETLIDYHQDGKTIIHTLQGVAKGQQVHVGYNGKHAVHIHVIKK